MPLAWLIPDPVAELSISARAPAMVFAIQATPAVMTGKRWSWGAYSQADAPGRPGPVEVSCGALTYISPIIPLSVLALSSEQASGHVRGPVSYTHLRAHETRHDLVCRL